MSFLIFLLFFFLGVSCAEEVRILQCLKEKSVEGVTTLNSINDKETMDLNNSSRKCFAFCILKEAVDPPFISKDGYIDIVGLKQHLLKIALFQYEQNEVLTLAQICANLQNEETTDECEKAYNFVKCFQNVKRSYCHNLFPCSDEENDDECHTKWTDSELKFQKINYTTATDWLRDREEVSKCRFLCMSRMLNYVNAAVIMNQKLISFFSKPYPIFIKKKIESAIRACSERNELDACERWYQFARCQRKVQNML